MPLVFKPCECGCHGSISQYIPGFNYWIRSENLDGTGGIILNHGHGWMGARIGMYPSFEIAEEMAGKHLREMAKPILEALESSTTEQIKELKRRYHLMRNQCYAEDTCVDMGECDRAYKGQDWEYLKELLDMCPCTNDGTYHNRIHFRGGYKDGMSRCRVGEVSTCKLPPPFIVTES